MTGLAGTAQHNVSITINRRIGRLVKTEPYSKTYLKQ